MKKFLKHCLPELIWIVSAISILSLIFYLTKMDLAVSRLALRWLLFLTVIYLGIRYLRFQHSQQTEAALKEAQVELFQLKSQMIADQRDMDDYFIHWVHQIKTPIAALQLMVDSSDPIPKTALKEQLLAIENYTHSALAYLKLTHPDTDLVIQPVTLDQVIAPLLKRYRWSFIHHHTQLNYHPIQDQVLTDVNWTQIMIEQLLNNALKYAKGQSITISYQAKNQTLTIADTGSGIQAQDLPKIFDKGYSGFNGRLNQESSGLGLYLVGQISQRLHQPVTVSSQPGQGSQFTIHFQTNLTEL